jgi:hypothetical protein
MALALVPLQIVGFAGMGSDRAGRPGNSGADSEIQVMSPSAPKKHLPSPYATFSVPHHGDGANHRTSDYRLI